MADAAPASQPPPAPPLPPSRTVLQRIIAPLSFNIGIRPVGSHSTQSSSASPRHVNTSQIDNSQRPSQTTVHRTGIPIHALDINREGTHAILAGHEILKTVRIQDGRIVEDFNLRSAINSYPSTYGPRPDAANQRREYLPAKDVRWSHGDKYSTVIATAALNGRISLYDVSRVNSSRVELDWIHDHAGQVNKIDFDPFGGYLLLSGSQDKTVKVWDTREPKSVVKRTTFNIRHPVRDLKWSPRDIGEFALCTESGIVQRWDFRKPTQVVLSINAHEKASYSIDWHPDGRHLASGGFDKYVRVWDMKSENRRQKPTYQLRTPQAVMNLRWRPACWSSELTGTGTWQCTQIATSYTDDDPRVHVWDLRRPLLPFRELDRYNSRPTDLIWASKDTLWTVGYEGMFAQTDVRYAMQVHDEMSPCTINFVPDNSFVTFTEDLRTASTFTQADPAAAFLKLPREELSGNAEMAISRSLSDEDADNDLFASLSQRRQSRGTSSRSAKSQGNTPPALESMPHVLSLEQSVPGRKDMFNNEQFGTTTGVEGIHMATDVAKFLALSYSRPATIEDRKSSPSDILRRLEEAFLHNADVCDHASLHRLAQSWRILCAVVIPELRDWADRNRRRRVQEEAKMRLSKASTTSSVRSPNPMPTPSQNSLSMLTTRSGKIANNFFKTIMAPDGVKHNDEQSPGIPTPLVMPLPDSPHPKTGEGIYTNLNELVEPIVPLPPSVADAHSTAQAASKALLIDNDDDSPAASMQSSSETPRRTVSSGRQVQQGGPVPTNPQFSDMSTLTSPSSTSITRQAVGDAVQKTKLQPAMTQEDRRAAIRDYKAQVRPLFTLDAPVTSPRYDGRGRHDSIDSFAMFSASTESSQKMPSVGLSFDSPAKHGSNDWRPVRAGTIDTVSSSESARQRSAVSQYTHKPDRDEIVVDSSIDDDAEFSFGIDVELPSQPPKVSASAKIWAMEDIGNPAATEKAATAASSASDALFPFEQTHNASEIKIYTSNPIRRPEIRKASAANASSPDLTISSTIVQDRAYVYEDFKPIDFTQYEPEASFAWSSLPLLCHTIAHDVQEGIASAQFSCHLIMHLHPFVFHQTFKSSPDSNMPTPEGLVERLMRPEFSHRLMEGLFMNHLLYLQRLSLYGPMAELKLLCVEFDYPGVFKFGQAEHSVGSSLQQDHFQLHVSCTNCHALMSSNSTVCPTCGARKDCCPVCLQVDLRPETPSASSQGSSQTSSTLRMFCQACGHGGHIACMAGWFVLSDSEGVCPSSACGCDCGPGIARDRRIKRQIADASTNEMIRGPRGNSMVAKRDSLRVSPSPAVDKTRDTLRKTSASERGMRNNSDETPRSQMSHVAGNGRATAHTSGHQPPRGERESFGSRKVRLVIPKEEGDDT